MAFSLVILSALVASALGGVVPQVGLGVVSHGLYNGYNGLNRFVQPAVGVAKAQPVLTAAYPSGFAVNTGLVNHGLVNTGLVQAAAPAAFVQPKAALVQPAVAKVPVNAVYNGYPYAPAATFVQPKAALVQPAVSVAKAPVAVAPVATVAKPGFGFGTFPSFAKNVPVVADKSFGLGFGDFANFGAAFKAPAFPSFAAPAVLKAPVVKKAAVVAAPAVPAVNKALLPAPLAAKGGLVHSVGVLPVGAVKVQPRVALPVQQYPYAQYLPAAVQPALVKQPVVSAFPKAAAVPVLDRTLPLQVPALTAQKTGVQLPATEPFANDFAGFSGNGEFQLLQKNPKGFFGQF